MITTTFVLKYLYWSFELNSCSAQIFQHYSIFPLKKGFRKKFMRQKVLSSEHPAKGSIPFAWWDGEEEKKKTKLKLS